jgi:calcineurin-like phosphoesterase
MGCAATHPCQVVVGRRVSIEKVEVAKNAVLLHGCMIEIDEATGKAVKIQRVSEGASG